MMLLDPARRNASLPSLPSSPTLCFTSCLIRIPWIVICLVLCSLPCCAALPRNIPPVASHGTLDLTGWDPEKDGILRLEGEWEVYWNTLLDPQDFSAKKTAIKAEFIHLPGTLEDFLHAKRARLINSGYATYRLVMHDAPAKTALAVHIPGTYAIYKIWVNGKLAAASGRIESEDTSLSRHFVSKTLPMDQSGEDVGVVIQASNYFFWSMVAKGALRLGTGEALSKQRHRNFIITSFLSGCLLIMGLYHLSLFLSRKKERASLYFGLFCVLIGIYSITINNEWLLAYTFPGSPWELYARLGLFIYILCVPIFSFLLKVLYPDEVSRTSTGAAVLIAAGFLVLAAVSTNGELGHIDQLYDLVVAVIGSCLIWALARAAVRRREGAWMAVGGGAVLLATVINDILYENGLAHYNNALPAGVFSFIVSYSFILSKRFSRAFSLIERHEKALQDVNVELETKVRERTASLEQSLRDKDILLKEIHHRVKNNMQVVVSLLNLQCDELRDEAASQAMSECKSRIKSMMLVHEKLYQSDNVVRIDCEDYIEHIVSDIYSTFGVDRRKIGFDVEAPVRTLNLDTAVPCGLIINELVSNSLKHAFHKKEQGGKITVQFAQRGPEEYELSVADNGVGLPLDVHLRIQSSLGMRLVYSLVQNQLHGDLRVMRDQGTRYTIRFRKQGEQGI